MLSKDRVRANFTDYLPWVVYTSYATLVQQGVHIGHSLKNFTAYSAWMVVGSHLGLCVINLFKFMYMFRAGLFIIQHVIRNRAPIWFVNLDPTAGGIIKSAANLCGEYWVSNDWVHGLISNFRRISRAGTKGLRKPKALWRSSDYPWVSNFTRWGWTRNTWPRTIFVSNGELSYIASHEAMCLGIPAITIVDTNARYKHINIAVPGNTSSFLTVSFYNFLVSMFIIYNKFVFVYNWFIYNWVKKSRVQEAEENTSYADFHSHIIRPLERVRINIFDYHTPTPLVYYNDGSTYFYQDIWKQRGLRAVYMKTRALGKKAENHLRGRVHSIYISHLLSSWALCKGYTYARSVRYTALFKRTFIGKRRAKGKIQYRGHGLRGRARLFGRSILYWLRKFITIPRLYTARAFNKHSSVLWKLNLDYIRGPHYKFVRKSRVHSGSEHGKMHLYTQYSIFGLALMFHIIHNANLYSTKWMFKSLVNKKRSPVTKHHLDRMREHRALVAEKTLTLLKQFDSDKTSHYSRVRHGSEYKGTRPALKLYEFTHPLDLTFTSHYMRYAGAVFNKRLHINTKYSLHGSSQYSIYIKNIKALISRLRVMRAKKSSKSKLQPSRPHATVFSVYNLTTSPKSRGIK